VERVFPDDEFDSRAGESLDLEVDRLLGGYADEEFGFPASSTFYIIYFSSKNEGGARWQL
jgi:hypothetical protein